MKILLSTTIVSLFGMTASLQAVTIAPVIDDTAGIIVGQGSFFPAENNGLTPLTSPMAGASHGSSARDGGYVTTSSVISSADGDYTLETYVGRNTVGWDWNSESRIGFVLSDADMSTAANMTIAIDAVLNDLDVTVSGPQDGVTTPGDPGAGVFNLYTYTITVADNGGSVFGSDLKFAVRWDINGGGSFFVDNVPEPSAAMLGILGMMGILRRRRH